MFRLLLLHYAYKHYSASTCKVQVRNFEANVADCFEVSDEDSDMCKPFTNAINTFQMELYLEHT